MKERIVYISSDEEITQIIAKLKSEVEASEKVFLVVPNSAQLFASSLNFKVLKKISEDSGFEIVLITSDRLGRNLAEINGIVSLSKLEFKKRKTASSAKQIMVSVVRRPIRGKITDDSRNKTEKFQMTDVLSKNKVPFEKADEENSFRDIETVPESSLTVTSMNKQDKYFKKISARIKSWQMGKFGKITLSFIGLSAIVVLFVLFLVLPKAEIIVMMQTSSFAYKTSLTVNTDLDQRDNSTDSIPGKKYEQKLEKSFKYQSTGRHAVGERARGEMTLYNKTWYTQPLVANTQLASEDGHIFRLDEAVILPPGSQTKVRVTADQPGSAYNVPPGKFVIVKLWEGLHDLIYGETTTAMSNGTDVDQMYVTQEDLNRAIEKSKAELIAQALQKIRENLPSDKIILDQAYFVNSFEPSSDAKVEAQVKEFTIKAKINITAVAYIKKDYEDLTIKQIKGLLTKDQQIVDAKLDTAKHTVSEFNLDAGTMKIATEGEVVLGRVLFEDALKAKLVGKTTGDAESFLTSQPQVERVIIKYWPFWVKRIPVQDGRIFIKAEYLKEK
jgi:hypothetical protein